MYVNGAVRDYRKDFLAAREVGQTQISGMTAAKQGPDYVQAFGKLNYGLRNITGRTRVSGQHLHK